MGLCGFALAAGAPSPPPAVLESMAAALGLPATAGRILTPQAGCAAAAGGVALSASGILTAIGGHYHWSRSDLEAIARERGAAAAVAEAYNAFGRAFLKFLRGAFVVVIIDIPNDRLLAAIDRIGQQQLYYAKVPGGLAFGSTAGSIRRYPQAGSGLSEQGIYNYIYFHMVPSPDSIYRGLHKLPNAHSLEFTADSIAISPYWQPAFSESKAGTDEALAREMQQIILQSVDRLAQGSAPGAFLSGGLDSSTVAGMLARLRPDAAETYSIGFDVDDYDETHYARIAARHFNTRHHEYRLTPKDVVDVLPVIAASYDEPFGNSSVVPTYFCARMAADNGVTRMLAGDGGDELFAGNARYAKQKIFEYYYRLPAGVQKIVVEPLLLNLPAGPALISKAQSYVRQANIPLPERLHTYNYLHYHAAEEIFSADFLAAVDAQTPLHLLRECYGRPPAASTLNRMLYLDWQQTLADNDLRKVQRMCQLAGVEVVFPLLDDALVEFSCRIPSPAKLKGRQLRYFYKKAMADFLPADIIAKTKHGFGMPFGIWMDSYRPLREIAGDSLSRLKTRHYIKPSFIDKALHLHRHEHSAYYGELVWILTMLELWLSFHTDNAAAADVNGREPHYARLAGS